MEKEKRHLASSGETTISLLKIKELEEKMDKRMDILQSSISSLTQNTNDLVVAIKGTMGGVGLAGRVEKLELENLSLKKEIKDIREKDIREVRDKVLYWSGLFAALAAFASYILPKILK